jgi:glycosyltransferase involved in cell wall biosynthesis
LSDYALSIVVPCYNEEAVIREFDRRLAAVRKSIACPSEVVFVNDGSRDGTLEILRELRSADSSITVVDLSRNFGKESAMTAGLDHSRGDAVIVIDADLQDPPELIPKLLERWRGEGADIVFAQRTSRKGESVLKRLTAYVFYRVMNAFGGLQIPKDTGDFRLLSRPAVDALLRLRERHRFMKGLFTWIGFKQVAVPYERDPRFAGTTKWNYWRLWNFSLEGITSFSTVPLRIASYFGSTIATLSACYGLFMIGRTLIFGNPVPGYPSLFVAVLFMGGVQLLFMGIIGEYVGRTFTEVKQRPLYLVNSISSSCAPGDRDLDSRHSTSQPSQCRSAHANEDREASGPAD